MEDTKSYIICATPRSGSTLLCDLLTGTRAAGKPNSFFKRESFSEWAAYFGVSTSGWKQAQAFDQSYLDAVWQEGTNGTSVFGMRLMWESLNGLSDRLDAFHPTLPNDNDRFEAAFGPCAYLYLSREDRVAQAVSRLKAEQSGLWHRFADGRERERLKDGRPPAYDVQRLSTLVAEAESHNTAWETWFSEQCVQPVRITYEALSNDPQGTLATVLSTLGLDPALANSIEPCTAKLADDESLEWAERFRRETKVREPAVGVHPRPAP